MTTDAGMPAALRAAFEAYEHAVVADDLAVLDASFADGPDVLRGDAAGLLVGKDAIRGFRSRRGGVAPRTIGAIEYRPLGPDTALLMSVSHYRDGGRGLQTQVWQRIDGTWRITAAHVTPRAAAFDRTVWRVVGDPLVAGAPHGPLAGLDVAVKDLFAIAGHATGAGNPAYLAEAHIGTTTAPAVADLLNAGSSVRGIARTDEFAYSIAGDNPHYGTPPNGALPGALPGGSSSGPASAVAAGFAAVGLATDTAGSIRVPASYQGLWGLRTTHGAVSRDGLVPLAPSFDTVGWITRDGDTLQRVADVCVGAEDAADLPWRFVVPRTILACADDATRAAFDALLVRLAASADAPEVAAADGPDLDACVAAFRTVQGAEAWRAHGAWISAHPGALGAAAGERFRIASGVPRDAEDAARADAAVVRDAMHALAADAVLLFPTVPGAAPARAADAASIEATRTATLRMTTPASVAGLPAITVPLLTVATDRGPAPVGVSLVARAGADAALVRVARRLARIPTPAPEDS